jgi:hypothetical protein
MGSRFQSQSQSQIYGAGYDLRALGFRERGQRPRGVSLETAA